jgi:general secretion pathway protein G
MQPRQVRASEPQHEHEYEQEHGRRRASSATHPGRQGGFTLIELLVVLAILGLLAALATPQVVKYLGKARADTARIEIKNISSALDLFFIDNGRYPTQQEGLNALVDGPGGLASWRGPYLKTKGPPADPWGRPYQYRYPGQHSEYDLYSLGADNAPGGTGDNEDIANW